MRLRELDIEAGRFHPLMRALRILAIAMILAGAAILSYAIITGEMRLALALFFIPVIYGSSWLGGLAIGLIVLGILLWMADAFLRGSSQQASESRQRPAAEAGSGPSIRKEFGGVVLIGPIPIVFGSSHRAALYAVVTAVVVLIFLILTLYFL